MPNSQSRDSDNTDDVSNLNTFDNKPTCQENQTSRLTKESEIIEQLRLEQSRINDLLCIFLIVALLTASLVAFCVTRSMLSFGFLSLLSLLPSMRRRKEETIFPISAADKEIKLRELDVEIERIRKQGTPSILSFLTWLKHIFGK